MFNLSKGLVPFIIPDLFSVIDENEYFSVSNMSESEDGYEFKYETGEAETHCINVSVEEEKYLCVEYSTKTKNSSSSFSAKEFIPEDANTETITADLKDGVLTVSMKKVK